MQKALAAIFHREPSALTRNCGRAEKLTASAQMQLTGGGGSECAELEHISRINYHPGQAKLELSLAQSYPLPAICVRINRSKK